MRRPVATLLAATDRRSETRARGGTIDPRDINGCQSGPKPRIIAAADAILIDSLARFGTA
jgi:hypothetical protein